MIKSNRRTFLQLTGAAAAATVFPASIRRALAIPAAKQTGTIEDIEHIVILTQENRSFDQYFGSLRGVRGFNDPQAVTLPSGNPVWYQPDGAGGYVLPFRPTPPAPAANLGETFIVDVDHGWNSSHDAWNNGNYDGWVPAKGAPAMIYMTRQDLPFHYALADAFTICDAYYCSMMGPTDPNRYHLWSGWTGNDGSGGGPVLANTEAGYSWTTYPERLQAAGVSWKIYQDVGAGLDAAHYWGWGPDPYIGNYGDNSLLYFTQYQDAAAGTPLAQYARTGTDIKAGGTLFDQLTADVANGQLPQVSWIVAPEAYTEHPNWIGHYGAWYIEQVLNALTANPSVWSKTVLFVNYDEAGGFFDHMTPPYPPSSAQQGVSTVDTTNAIFTGSNNYPGYAHGPYGLGTRVPMIVISPWTVGGYVCSQVFDHTSLIRFIEKRFGVAEPNITDWRKTVCGDLTAAFDFANVNLSPLDLPNTNGWEPTAEQILDVKKFPDFVPVPPADQSLSAQEPGTRYARALPYALEVSGRAAAEDAYYQLDFKNTGTAGACFLVRSNVNPDGPWTVTVEAGKSTSFSWPTQDGDTAYDLAAYGPNGFLRRFAGGFSGLPGDRVEVSSAIDEANRNLSLTIINRGAAACRVVVTDGYTDKSETTNLAPGRSFTQRHPLQPTDGWYDLTVSVDGKVAFLRRFAGHAETGADSISDPLLGAG